MITVYGIPNCDSVKKTRRWLEENQTEYCFYDFKKQGVPQDEAKRWLEEAGVDVVINKRGTTWRRLSAEQKLKLESAPQTLQLITGNSSLIKRPVITSGHHLLFGFDEEFMGQIKQTSTQKQER